MESIAMDVGFIGIGSMGAAIVPNLVKAGHRVSVWNRDLDAEGARKRHGSDIASSSI